MNADQETLISVAVPCRNYEQYIGKCLESILMQKYQNYEVLICDGSSSDKTLQIARKFCEMDNRFRIVSESDSGQADAIQKAFTIASGQIFCFLNADDYYLSNLLFKKVNLQFKEYPDVDIITYKTCFVDKDNKLLSIASSRVLPMENLSDIVYRGQVVQPGTFWRKAVQSEIPLRPEYHYYFDSVFFYLAYQRYSILQDSTVAAAYRLHGINKSVAFSINRVKEHLKFLELKFGKSSFVYVYGLTVVGLIVGLTKIPFVGMCLAKCVAKITKIIHVVTIFRMPSF